MKVNLDWIESEVFENEDPAPFLEHVNGILVPGGFGSRGSRRSPAPPFPCHFYRTPPPPPGALRMAPSPRVAKGAGAGAGSDRQSSAPEPDGGGHGMEEPRPHWR